MAQTLRKTCKKSAKNREFFEKASERTPHGSLEAILGRTKLSTKTKTGDG
jgi:hypothetical protein